MNTTLSVTLAANAQPYLLGMRMASQATQSFGRTVEREAQRIAVSSKRIANQTASDLSRGFREAEQGMQNLSRSSVVGGAAIAAGIGLAVAATMRFDKEMSTLRGVAGASAQEFAQLRETVLAAGQATVFSASQAAKGATELARAGVSARDIINGGLVGALNLAAAGQLELSRAAEIAASAMNVFGLSGRDVNHVADVLAASANKAQGGVGDMGLALQQSSLVASQFGLSLEDTVGSLTLFASRGLIGSDAGTSFKTMLQRLVPFSDEAAKKMKELGINMFDAQGNFVGIQAAAGELNEGLRDLSQEQRVAALNTIFGSDAVRAATVLYEAGADGVKQFTDSVNQQGAAAALAETNMDNLAGDLEKLKGALETALIRTGDSSTGVLRKMTQETTNLVDGFTALPAPVRSAGLALAGVTSAMLLAVGVAGTMIPKYREVQQALEAMGTTGQRLGTAMSVVTRGLLIAGPVIAAAGLLYGQYAARKQEAVEVTNRLSDALRQEELGQKGAGDAALIAELQKQKLLTTVQALGINQADLNNAIRGEADAHLRVSDAILATLPGLDQSARSHDLLARAVQGDYAAYAEFVEINKDFYDAHKATGDQITSTIIATQDLRKSVGAASEKNKELTTAQDQVSKSSRDAAGGINATGMAAGLASGQVAELTERQKALQQAFNSFATPASAFQAAQQKAQEAARDTASTIASSSKESTRAERQAIQDRYASQRQDLQNTKENISNRTKAGKDAVNQELTDLSRREKAELQSFDQTHKATSKGKEAFADLASSVRVSLNAYITELNSQNTAMAEWQKNLVKIAARVGPDVAVELAKLGPQAAGAIQEFANTSDAESQKAANAIRENMRLRGLSVDIDQSMTEAAIRAGLGAGKTAEAIARELGIGLDKVKAVADQYFGVLAGTARVVIKGVGGRELEVVGSLKPGDRDAKGNLKLGPYVTKAEGGFLPQQATIAAPRTLVQWAEPETGGEAFIPLTPTKRQRSTQILNTVASQFGYELLDPRNGGSKFADGGFRGLPTPPKFVTRAVGAQVAETLMNYAYMEVSKKLNEQGLAGNAEVGMGYGAIINYLRGAGVPYTVTSTTGGRHAKGSYHYQGKAVDLVGPNMMAIFRALEKAAGNLSELFYDPAGYSYKRGKRIGPIGGHSDHVHAATYDRGGTLQPGWTMAYNGTGKAEHVMTEAQIDRIVDAIATGGGHSIIVQGQEKPVETAREMRRLLK